MRAPPNRASNCPKVQWMRTATSSALGLSSPTPLSASTRRAMLQKRSCSPCVTIWVLIKMSWCRLPATAQTIGPWSMPCCIRRAKRVAWQRSGAVSAMKKFGACMRRACAPCGLILSSAWLTSRPKTSCWRSPAASGPGAGMLSFILRPWTCPSCGISSRYCLRPWWWTTWAARM